MINKRFVSNEKEPIFIKNVEKIKEEVLKKRDVKHKQKILCELIDFMNIPNFWMEKTYKGFVYKKVNDKMLELLKRDRSDLLEKTASEVFGSRLGIKQDIGFNACFNIEEEYTCFLSLLNKEEMEKYCYMTLYPYYDDKGCIGVIGFLIDMTFFFEEQKELEMGFRNMGFFIWKLDVKNMIYTKNKSLYTLDEDIETDFFKYAYSHIHNEDCEGFVEGILDFIDGKDQSYQSEYRCLNNQGKWIWVRSIAYGVKYDQKGNLKEILGANIDITELKRLTVMIKDRNENKFNMMIENIPDIIIKLDLNYRFTYASDSYCFLVKRSSEEIIGKKVGFGILEEDLELLDKTLENVQNNIDGIVSLRYPYNEYRNKIIEWHMGQTYNESGTQNGIVGIGRDVTNRQSNINEMLDQINKDNITELLSKKKIFEIMIEVFGSKGRKIKCAGILIEISHMGRIKETLGDIALEEFLIEISEILQNNSPPNGHIARISEDEFFIFIENYLVKDDLKKLIELITEKLYSSIPLMRSSFMDNKIIGGIAFYPDDAINHYELLNCANMAKENAKKEDLFYELYDSNKLKKYNFDRDLFYCIQDESFKNFIGIEFKPIINLQGKEVGYEPVLQWEGALEKKLEEKLFNLAEAQGKRWDIILYKIQKAIKEKPSILSNSLIKFKLDMKDLVEREQLNDLIILCKNIPKNFKIIIDLQGNVLTRNNAKANKIINKLKSSGIMTAITLKYSDIDKIEEIRLLHVDILTMDIKNLDLGKGNSFNESVIKIIIENVTEQKKEIFIEGVCDQAEIDFFINNGFKIIGLSQSR